MLIRLTASGDHRVSHDEIAAAERKTSFVTDAVQLSAILVAESTLLVGLSSASSQRAGWIARTYYYHGTRREHSPLSVGHSGIVL